MNSLFAPITIGNMSLKNRLVMPPMALDHATETGEVTERILDHYLDRARPHPSTRAGIGLIILEHTYVSVSGRSHPRQLGIYDHFLIPGLQILAQQLQAENVPVGIQITHAGARAMEEPCGPSPYCSPYLKRFGNRHCESQESPHALTVEEIESVVKDFAEGAVRAVKAGFDMIEIHGAHGYLLNQFYSPLTNHRTDQYGGSLQNRLRLPVEVIRAVRHVIGKEIPLFYRLGADDLIPGGNTIIDSLDAAPLLVEAGVDCLDLSGGIGGYLQSGPEGFFVYMAEELKKVVNIPILVTGGIRGAQTADRYIRENKTDLIGVGRALLEDPDWARNAWFQLCNY